MPSEFVHLHVHTEYSLLDGQSRIDDLMKRAKELEMPAVGISDHGVMFGVIDFYRAAKKAGIKPVLGMEAYLAPRQRTDKDSVLDKKPFHMLLFAKNNTGYKNLMKLASIAQLEGYYYRPRIDWETLDKYHEGIIATSGCLAAEIPKLVEDGKDAEARAKIGKYLEIFGEDNFYLELQPHKIGQLQELNKWIVDYRKSNHSNVQVYASNDVHYVRQSDWEAHDTLLCIQTGALKHEENRMRMEPHDSYFMKSSGEMREEFLKYGMPEAMIKEAFANSLKIAEMTDVNLDEKGYHLPIFPVPPEFEGDSAKYLRYLCEMGLEWRFPGGMNDPVLVERLNYELDVIGGMGFNTYFLIVWDLCEFAREADIWWNVRGSGAGSLVAYSLGITNIDPIQNSLLFERFLNAGRVSMPDIDLDYPDDRRGEMIAYAVDKYGKDKVAAIITFGTMGAKASVKDVGRALDVDLGKINSVTSLIPQDAKQKQLQEYIDANPELQDKVNKDPEIKKVMDAAIQLQGLTRHASTHAAGVIIGDRPLDEYTPLHRVTGTDPSGGSLEAVTQFPMETAESIGLLKVDFLGLSTLTILRKACDLINKHHGTNYTMDNVPYRHDDTKQNLTAEQLRMLDETFAMFGRGETIGVFQVESGGMQEMLRGMRPQTFEHIIAGISLYRPGPMDFIPAFNKRLHGDEVVPYKHQKLEPILKETFGICIAGDSIVIEAKTGKRYRIDELEAKAGDFYVQGVDNKNQATISKVSHWFDNGVKPVYRIRLRNGASIKATADHRFLTERGWVELQDLVIGDYVATPKKYLKPEQHKIFDRDKLRILGYIIADGGVSNMAQVNFYSKDTALVNEYLRCLQVFEDVEPSFIKQVRGVARISAIHKHGRYVTSLLAWMRELGLKYPAGQKRGGVLSHEKFVPEFVFELSNDDIAYFLASLWDCDGYVERKLCHYKTISPTLANDVQTLLLRLGIPSVIHTADYENEKRGKQTSYQVTVYDTEILASFIQSYMVTWKKDVLCEGRTGTTIRRDEFITEAVEKTALSARAMMETYGIDRQHFYKRRSDSERITEKVVNGIAEAVPLENTLTKLKVNWEAIVEIEAAGEERVYDITVEGIHNFIANNIIVHNCVYQEQIMQIAQQCFGYERSEADLMRRAVSKKKAEDLAKHKDIFKTRGPENGIPVDVAEAIFDEIEFFANYGFNKCLVSSTEIVDSATGRIVTIGDLYNQKASVGSTLSLNTDSLRLQDGVISDVMFNGVKPVFRLTTQTGREIVATGNHPFYSFDGWQNLEDLQVGDRVAVPRRIEVEGKKEWPQHKVVVLGHLLAEGNLCHPTGIYYYTADEEQWQDYVSHLEQFENTQASTHIRRDKMHDVYSKRINRGQEAEIVSWIEKLGLRNTDSYTKFIPDEVFELKNEPIALMISRMWEGDGHINEKGRSLYYATSSKRMVHQLQHLLLRLGIVSSIRQVIFPYKDGRTGYQLFVTGNENFRAFDMQIAKHFVSKTRREIIQRLILENPESAGVKDIVPVGIKHYVRREKDASGKAWNQVSLETGLSITTFNRLASGDKEGFTHKVISQFAEYFDSNELRKYADNDIYWDKIESIEYVGEEETYDLTIEGTHNFVANDIIVHNSHAADYAVITVQTAFLKCHYPAEYMTALLTVQFDTKEKVATFLAECRRLQIPVLPPHVNNSAIDFDIEITDTGKRGIRFGMGAIKNAGVGATQLILDERQKNGKFANLMDFCQRVDLRQVGKRAVESLIKVGAFEGWGERDDLLYSLERIIGYSGDYHKAKEVGQKSLFGDVVDSSESLDIPEAPSKEKVSRRLQLKWEKDLMGLYVSGRPVDKHVDKFNAMGNLQIISQLKDPEMPYPTEQIKLAGEVVSIKKLVTKNNDAMAIVLLEDWHETAAQIEVVMFPKAWKQVRDYVENHKLNNSENTDENQNHELRDGDILLVMGKVDKSKGDAQILCDKVSFEFEMMTAIEIEQTMRPREASWMNGNGYHGSHEEPPMNLDFDEETGEVVRETLPALPPIVNKDEPKYLTQALEVASTENPFGDLSGKQENGRESVHISVHFQRSSDSGRDRRRLRRIHAAMMEYPGKDSFSIVLEGGAKASIMDFPNHHTGLCDALMQELEDIVGAGNVHIEDKSVKH